MDKETKENVTTSVPPEKSEADRNADAVAQQVNDLLKQNNLALQPYLIFDERGMMPAVRLILKEPALDAKVTDNAATTTETKSS